MAKCAMCVVPPSCAGIAVTISRETLIEYCRKDELRLSVGTHGIATQVPVRADT